MHPGQEGGHAVCRPGGSLILWLGDGCALNCHVPPPDRVDVWVKVTEISDKEVLHLAELIGPTALLYVVRRQA
eukprot:7603496-Pyramimonas_sp.AAC.1